MVYINELRDLEVGGRLFTYADDTAIVFAGPSRDRLIQNAEEGFEKNVKWFHTNKLSINVAKTKYFYVQLYNLEYDDFGLRLHRDGCQEFRLCVCDRIGAVDSYRYLGVVVDRNLIWNNHILGKEFDTLTKTLFPSKLHKSGF